MNPLIRILVVLLVSMAVLGSLIALADTYMKDSKWYYGPYLYLWAYVEGYAEQDEFGCYTGVLYNVWGAGGGDIYGASGKIEVQTPPPVTFGEAKTTVRGVAYIDGKKVDEKEVIARIWVPVGAC